MGNSVILTENQEMELRKKIDSYVGKIQTEIDSLRADGTDKVIFLQNHIGTTKRDRTITKEEKDKILAKDMAELEKAKAEEERNKSQVSSLLSDAEAYIKIHFDKEYYQPVCVSCQAEKAEARQQYQARVDKLKAEHQEAISKLSGHQEIKDEKYVFKNKLFDAKMNLEKELHRIKDRKHSAYMHKYHLLDLLRMSKFTFAETCAQKWENYKYTFNRRAFLLQNGLYIAILLVFIALCIITPVVKNAPLLTYNNVLNISTCAVEKIK